MEETAGADPTLSVVIPTYQRRDSVARALEGLERQTLSSDRFEVVVVCDGSNDGTLEHVRSLRLPYMLTAVQQPNRGRASACNAGVAHARGDVVLLLDDDMRPMPGCLEAHLSLHPAGSRRCVMGAVPAEIPLDAPQVAQVIGAKFDGHLRNLAVSGRLRVIRDFYTGNASIRREVFRGVGGFDDEFREYGNEDLELAIRLMAAGVSIEYSEAASALQTYDKDFASLARDTVAKGRTAILLARKHPEMVPQLRLGTWSAGSARWRLLRSLLLRLPRAASPENVVRLTEWLERRPLTRLSLYYTFVLDYLYWVGARDAVAAGALCDTSSTRRGRGGTGELKRFLRG
jgi:GT2 family glycosyltransferase